MALMMGSGIALGVVFDSYRVWCEQLSIRRWLIPALDLIYWLLATVFVFRVLYSSNYGEVRFYVFLGLLVGIWLYFLWFSTITVRFVIWLSKMTRRLIRFAVRCFHLLIVTPLRMLYRLIRIIVGFAIVLTLFIGRLLLYIIRPLWLLLLFLLRPLFRKITLPKWVRVILNKGKQIWIRWF